MAALLCPRLVGREAERSQLDAVAAAGLRGVGRAVVVSGDAGIGKSALVRAALPADRTVVAGGGPAALAEWVVALVERGADPARLEAHRAVLAAVAPGLLGPTAAGDAPHPVVIGDAIVRLWATLPVPRRPVLLFEDAHWADEVTWEVLRRVVERGQAAGAPVIITARPEGPRLPGLRRLVASRHAVGMTLEPLGPGSVARMVEACLRTSVAPVELLREVAVAGGSPLLVEELLADLARSGALRPDGTTWAFTAGAGVPASVRAGTQARLATLDDEQRRIVERAAVLGTAVDTLLIGASFAITEDGLATAVEAAVVAGLLEVAKGTGVPRFRHELVREAVVADLLDVRRRGHAAALLAAVGDVHDPDWAASLPDERLGLAARLAAEVGDTAAAASLHLRHAERLAARGLPLAAAEAAERAIEAADAAGSAAPTSSTGPAAHSAPPGWTVGAAALAVLVEALALAGEVDRALAAAKRLRTRRDVGLAPRTWAAVVRAVAEQGDWERAARMLDRVRAVDEPSEVTALAALIELERGRTSEAASAAHRVLGPGAPACQAMEVLGRIARESDLAIAQDWFQRAVAEAERSGLALWRARALHEVATIAQLRTLDVGPLRTARTAAVDAGAPGLVAAVDFHLAAVLGVQFAATEALEIARRLLVDARALGARRQEAWAWVLIAQAHAVGGARPQAEVAAAEAERLAPYDREIRGIAATLGRGLAALLADDRNAGVTAWREGITALRAFHGRGAVAVWYPWPVLATVADVEGDGGTLARAETAAPGFWGGTGPEGLLLLATAVAAGRAGDRAAAARAAERADALLAEVPALAGWCHLTRRWVVEDAIAAGWGAPGAWMTEATAWFGDRGFVELAAACRGLGRRAGVPQRRRGRGDSPVPVHLMALGVTSREVDVLRLVAEGLTNAEIAERLYLSPRTVKGYVEQLLAKTGTANRVQLAPLLTERIR